MEIEVQARKVAKEISVRYGMSKPTLENIIFIIEENGYELLEYSKNDTTSSTYQIIKNLNLMPYAISGKAFTYRNNNAKVVFICEEMNATEKLYALAHELGHIVCCHLCKCMDQNEIEQEYMANEFAHFLLNPTIVTKIGVWMKNNKRVMTASAIIMMVTVFVAILMVNILQSKTYYKEYYITDSGKKYHESNCIFIKDKTNIRRLTEKEYYSNEYNPCQICLPD